MPTYRYEGKKGKRQRLVQSRDLIAVRTRRRVPLARVPLSRSARVNAEQLEPVARFDEAGVEVLRCPRGVDRDETRRRLKQEDPLRFAGRVLADPGSRRPVLYTENLFVKFEDDTGARECRRLLRAHGLAVKRPLGYARNAFFVSAPEGTGQRVFEMAAALLAEEPTLLCHPELVREVDYRQAFPQQWHLKATTVGGRRINAHASVEAAWASSRGEGVTIAVIDSGFDLEHEELRSAGKITAPRDATRGNDNPRPRSGENHGTACAGVACADGRFGASGVAPRAALMPIRLRSGLGSQAEADAFVWAAEHGADVISCSWGPPDGRWWDDDDPLHQQVVALPDSTRLAIDWAVRNGRNGRGCVITWAAGNGNESVGNDGYARYDKVIAVAACNDRGTRSAYSDHGDAVWCAFPSNDVVDALTPGIWTTDRSGAAGYNPGDSGAGDGDGHYTATFGGTSSACPGAAGVAALVLARNPALRWDQVKDILRRAAERIDPQGGRYDADGHSPFYGYGRVDARKAVALALPPQPRYVAVHTAIQDTAIEDLTSARLAVAVGDRRSLRALAVSVDIEHTYIGDLVVRLLPPDAMGAAPVTLHERTGGGADNLKTTYDAVSTPGLGDLAGRSPAGTWVLEVHDAARQDTGRIKQVSLRLEL